MTDCHSRYATHYRSDCCPGTTCHHLTDRGSGQTTTSNGGQGRTIQGSW